MNDKPSVKSLGNPMWGGQFGTASHDLMRQINASIHIDKKLYAEDIAGSKAHADMLAAQSIISAEDNAAIQKGLDQIKGEIERGEFKYDDALEDIHMHVESRLKEIIGAPAGRLHTARSRNDQVALDFRMYVRSSCERVEESLKYLQWALLVRAEEHAAAIMPGFTHLQTAQPVTLGHHLLAYVEMFDRDRSRFLDARTRMNESPLGAAALAGTSFPVDRHATAEALGFNHPMRNSLDAVASRDFALEYLSAASVAAVHLSRLAEEMILWSSAQFAFIRFSDEFSTGSSIMPQKRNPDAAELVRGKAGRLFGNLMGLLTTMKALPLAYNKDMQEDKEPLFDTEENLLLCIRAMEGMVQDFKASVPAMETAASNGFSTATDLADWLVRTLGLPFRDAHHATARIVKIAAEKNISLEQVPLDEMQAIEPRITPEIYKVLSVDDSAASRTSFGGTAPENVTRMIAWWKQELA